MVSQRGHLQHDNSKGDGKKTSNKYNEYKLKSIKINLNDINEAGNQDHKAMLVKQDHILLKPLTHLLN